MASTRGTQEITKILSSVKTELPPSSVPNEPEGTDVALRAYEIYESRGRVNGADFDDWLQAERELHGLWSQRSETA